jgi:hypothetical protein
VTLAGANPAGGESESNGTESADNTGAFLSVFAALLLDNVLRLDETAGRVTDLVMGNGRPDREMVVALQAFDRLKQEFEALGDALARYADATNGLPLAGEERAKLGREIVATITVHDLKDRLLLRLQDDLPMMPAPSLGEVDPAEIDVDVEF